EYRRVFDWLNNKLPCPPFEANADNWYLPACWWKTSQAAYFTSQMDTVVNIVKKHGEVLLIKSDDPGIIAYEDAFQVVAEPYHDDMAQARIFYQDRGGPVSWRCSLLPGFWET